MKEKVIIINGSPRKKGYSSQLAEYISDLLNKNSISNKVFNLYEMNIDYCTNCGYCSKVRKCRINDDMNELYELFDDSISTILISPVAFDGPMAKVKAMVERTNVIYHSKYTLNDSLIDRSKKRIGFHIQIGGSPNYPSQFEGGRIINGFFFKSINAKLRFIMNIDNTDKRNPFEDEIMNNYINPMINSYINEVKELM